MNNDASKDYINPFQITDFGKRIVSAKLVILSILFVISAGSFAAERFRQNKALVSVALIISVSSTYYLYESIVDDFENSTSEATFELARAVDDLRYTNSKITNENAELSSRVAQLQLELSESLDSLQAERSASSQPEEVKRQQLLFLQELRDGITREIVISSIGEPARRRRIGSSQLGTSLIEVFYLHDRMLRVLWSNDRTVSAYCVTTLRPGVTFSTRDGFVIGRDKFSRLPTWFDEPQAAKWDFGNWSGSYFYEETGGAPTVSGGGFSGFFSFHGIQDFYGPKAIYSSYVPHYDTYRESGRLQLLVIGMPEDRPTLNSAGRIQNRYGQEFIPPRFQEEYEKFRSEYSPDTFCSGGAKSFRQANQDLEEYEPDFRRYVRGQ